MNTSTHRLCGFAAGLGAAAVLPMTPAEAVGAVAVAVLTAGGPLSPDMDQRKWWRLLDRVIPDEWLGNGGPLQHRGITHWWGVILTGVVVAVFTVGFPWWAAGLTAGWGSHLLGDAVYGARSPGRGPGVPLGPWWGHHGAGLHSGGRGEIFVGRPVLVFLATGLLLVLSGAR